MFSALPRYVRSQNNDSTDPRSDRRPPARPVVVASGSEQSEARCFSISMTVRSLLLEMN